MSTPIRLPTFIATGLGLALVCLGLAGWRGLLYGLVFAAATMPGWPIGRRLFGSHPAAWISGAILGYGLTAVALWLPVAVGLAWWLPLLLAWTLLTGGLWLWLPARPMHLVDLPEWSDRVSSALVVLLLVVVVLAGWPYARVGELDAKGQRRYRAYFTADFVWHEALSAELSRFTSPPRNPYMADEPLRYYWLHFRLPATLAAGVSPPAPLREYLAVNGLGTGLLFVSAIFLVAWSAVPRAGPALGATMLALLASSAEGLYATIDLLRRGRSLLALTSLNIDAITAWYFQGLTVDGLQRSLWYNQQHSMACALGLVALLVAGRTGAAMSARGSAACGLALGLALMISPFPGGALLLVYTAVLLWDAACHARRIPGALAAQCPAVAMVGAALAWSVANHTFEGAGGAVALGISDRAAREPVRVLGLALGPLLLPASLGLLFATFRRWPREIRPSACGVLVGLSLFYGVTLVLEPIWIGWRAGQILLVTAPGLVALTLAVSNDRLGRGATAVLLGLLFAAGLPTTAIDFYNAQDTSNERMGPGFRWTVVLRRDEQAALAWIEAETAADAVVQMSVGPRGRETWSLIPSFARRRMAAGLPISLLLTPAYQARAARADHLYATPDPHEAWAIARELGVDYVYVGRVEREAFGSAVDKFEAWDEGFRLVFSRGDSAVYAVQPEGP